MNDLLVLVKLLSALYQAKKLNDKNLIKELEETLEEIPPPPPDVFSQDKDVREGIKNTIAWLLKQADDEPVLKQVMMQRVRLFAKNDEAIKLAIEDGLEDFDSEEMTRKVIYKHLSEVRLSFEDKGFADKWKKAVKQFFFKEHTDISKDEWVMLSEMINDRMAQMYEDKQSEVLSEINTADPSSFHAIIDQAKLENSKEGIIKSGIQALNLALDPDGGFRRGKFYLLNALTNRGKSLTVAHLTASAGLYNTPLLRNAAKIPTILMESAEDTMDLIIIRMYKLAITTQGGDEEPDFNNAPRDEIINAICKCFADNGWVLLIKVIDSNKDSAQAMFDRVRKLELKGHEIIWYAYDYCALQNYDMLPGDSKSDKLQLHIRKIRAFIIGRGICFLTPHQLSPDAKKRLQEADEESEVYFAREVAGKSYTETSTKITNEVDVEITFHVAKTSYKSYWTFCIGKQRGEGCKPENRFAIYDIHPIHGLRHDINGKPRFRRSLQTSINDDGEVVNDFDNILAAAA